MEIREAIQIVTESRHLSMDQAADVMTQIMEGRATPAQFGALVTALRMKGETPEEIAGMARVMRDKALRVEYDGPVVDTCGTGGDGLGTFNISTTAAFVVAGAGVIVAKHGNRAMSSSSGSADSLEALGVNINLGPDGVKRCLEEIGIGFMFAQTFHPAMKYAGMPRREIGIRTIFNLLGPVTNPAGAARQIIGMADGEAAARVASALALLGTEHALIVRGEDGADEISIEGPTRMWEVMGNEVRRRLTRPSEFGLPEGDRRHLIAPTLDRSVELMRNVLEGHGGGDLPPGVAVSARNVVIINAAAALLVAGKALTMADGAKLATDSIDSGEARRKLEDLVELSGKLE